MNYLYEEQKIQALYVGLLGRPADRKGLEFWDSVVDEKISLSDAATYFSVSPESQKLYPLLRIDNKEEVGNFVNVVYQNLFNRNVEDAGKAYWVEKIVSGMTVGEAILTIMNSAQGDDKKAVLNKISVADSYTFAADLSNKYNIDFARNLIDHVGNNDNSVQNATDKIKAEVYEKITVTVEVPVYINTPQDIEYKVGNLHQTSTKNFTGNELWVGSGIYADDKIIAVNKTSGFELALGANYRQGNQLTGTVESPGVIRITAEDGHQVSGKGGAFATNASRSAVNFDFTFNTGVNDLDGSGLSLYLMIDTDASQATNFTEVLFKKILGKWIGFDTATNIPVINDDVLYKNVIQDSVNFGFGFLSSKLDLGPVGSGDIKAGEYEVYAEVRDGSDVVTKVGIIFDLV